MFTEMFSDRLHNFQGQGWDFSAGDPESWKFSSRLLKPGGKVLDLGIGGGRASLFFALHDMEVTGIDLDSQKVEWTNDMARANRLKITATVGDITKIDFPKDYYDLVLLSEVFVHFPGKTEALEVVEKSWRALKREGHIWIRTVGKLDEKYEELVEASELGYAQKVSEDVFIHPCACSGEWKDEPALFVHPLDLHFQLASLGARIVHSQVIPEDGQMNVLFGEDWNNPNAYGKRNGAVTVLAQKR